MIFRYEIKKITQENLFENVVCEIAAILSRNVFPLYMCYHSQTTTKRGKYAMYKLKSLMTTLKNGPSAVNASKAYGYMKHLSTKILLHKS